MISSTSWYSLHLKNRRKESGSVPQNKLFEPKTAQPKTRTNKGKNINEPVPYSDNMIITFATVSRCYPVLAWSLLFVQRDSLGSLETRQNCSRRRASGIPSAARVAATRSLRTRVHCTGQRTAVLPHTIFITRCRRTCDQHTVVLPRQRVMNDFWSIRSIFMESSNGHVAVIKSWRNHCPSNVPWWSRIQCVWTYGWILLIGHCIRRVASEQVTLGYFVILWVTRMGPSVPDGVRPYAHCLALIISAAQRRSTSDSS